MARAHTQTHTQTHPECVESLVPGDPFKQKAQRHEVHAVAREVQLAQCRVLGQRMRKSQATLFTETIPCQVQRPQTRICLNNEIKQIVGGKSKFKN